jgi:guanylate kinase
MSIVFAISEALGSGRSSVVNLVHRLLDNLDLAICYTTRTPHTVEDKGSRFFFTSHKAFERMIAREEFLEYVSIRGNYYGTPNHCLRQAQEGDRDLLIPVDHHGAQQIKQKIPEAVSILILPGQFAQGAQTIGSTINRRLPSLLQGAPLPSQIPNYDKYDQIIVNDRPEDSANKVIEIIRSERQRRSSGTSD